MRQAITRGAVSLRKPSLAVALVCPNIQHQRVALSQLTVAKPVVLDYKDLSNDNTTSSMNDAIATAFGPSGTITHTSPELALHLMNGTVMSRYRLVVSAWCTWLC
jgi:hypothetical protein